MFLPEKLESGGGGEKERERERGVGCFYGSDAILVL